MKTGPSSNPSVAYSYIRFSSPEQAKGDSLRRQTQAAVDWCQRNEITLDTSLTLRDLGRSAFLGEHRKNHDRYALAAFLKLAREGRIPKGSYLVIENLDRLSREDERPALRLWLDILDMGINIVQLTPETVFKHEKSDMTDIIRAIIELSRGHSESKIKSQRIAAAWEQKRKAARKDGEVMTNRLPAWIEERDGKLQLLPGPAAAIRRIFELAASGYGHQATIVRLVKEGVAPFGSTPTKGHTERWARSYVTKLLNDRRVVGEFQPRKRDRSPEGEPIPGYYPAVVTEAEWYSARAGAAQRKLKRGRLGKHINVFSGLVKSARDGSTYFCTSSFSREHKGRKNRHRVLKQTSALEGRSGGFTFPFATFEAALFSKLPEVDPHEILNGDDGPDETTALAGELAGVEARITELEKELLTGEVASVVRVLRQLEERKKELVDQLTTARQKAAHPLSEAWGESKSLLTAINTAPDPTDARLRLRAALRRIIDTIFLLVIPRGRNRLAVVQVWFEGKGRVRTYLIYHKYAKANGSSRVEGTHHVAPLLKEGGLDPTKREAWVKWLTHQATEWADAHDGLGAETEPT